jgi:predicted nucleic acid-binding protein
MRKTVAVDASFLIAFLDRKARSESVAALIKDLSDQKAKVIIPTPVLAEVLTHAPDAAPAYMTQINRCACFQVRPFDDKASIELAQLLGTNVSNIRDILRFDRQIVAIAKVCEAAVLYADDEKVAEFAAESGLQAIRFRDLG